MAFQLTSFDLVTPPGGNQQHYDFFILPKPRALVSGVVRRPDGTPVPGAVVAVFRKEGDKLGPAIGHTFTDQDGHFFLGPLAPGGQIPGSGTGRKSGTTSCSRGSGTKSTDQFLRKPVLSLWWKKGPGSAGRDR